MFLSCPQTRKRDGQLSISWKLIRRVTPAIPGCWLLLAPVLAFILCSPKDAGPRDIQFRAFGWATCVPGSCPERCAALADLASFPALSHFRMGVPFEIACSVRRVTFAQQGPTPQGLKEPRPPAQTSLTKLLRSVCGRGTSLAQGPAADPAGHRLPRKCPTSGSTSSHPRWVMRWRESGAYTVPLGNPRTPKSQHQLGATLFRPFLTPGVGPACCPLTNGFVDKGTSLV